MPIDEMELARHATMREMADGIQKEIDSTRTRHGPDPRIDRMVATVLIAALLELTEDDANATAAVIEVFVRMAGGGSSEPR